MAADQTNEILTEDEFIELMGITKRTARYWRANSVGPAFVKVGAKTRYRRASIDTWMATHESPIGASPAGQV